MSLAIALAVAALAQAPQPAARAIVDTAIARMGGADALSAIRQVRFDMMTEWQRITFDDRPYTDMPSYERHTDLRDYSIAAWRNARNFGARTVVDLVRDSIAVRNPGEGWAPLNVAYVDERDELFLYTPDRLMLLARAAPDLRLLRDTAIDGMPHARVSGTLGRFPATIFFRRADGLPAMLRFRAAHFNDYGLTPWGEMDVEVWYAQWRPIPGGVTIPGQWNIRRVGKPYKRVTVLSAAVNPGVPADSFAVDDGLRRGFFETANRPMHDLPVDSATITDDRIVSFFGFGNAAGAVRIGDRWFLLEAGQHALNFQRASEWLRSNDRGAVGGAFIGLTRTGNGGVVQLATERLPIYTGAGADPFVRVMLRNAGVDAVSVQTVGAGRWLRVGTDSVRLESIDLPDARGSLAVYVPALRWVYVSNATTPLDIDLVRIHAQRQGWMLDRIGTARAVVMPLPPSR